MTVELIRFSQDQAFIELIMFLMWKVLVRKKTFAVRNQMKAERLKEKENRW